MRGTRRALVVVGALLVGGRASAQGYGLNEMSSCSIARGFATTATPCDDGSYIHWNPAAGTQLRGKVLGVGGTGISIDGAFTQDRTRQRFDAQVPVQVPPHLFASYRYSPRVALGLGVYVPYGLTSEWGEDFPGRFIARRATLQAITAQPTVSIDLIPGQFAIGAGVVINRTAVGLEQAIDLSSTTARAAQGATPAVTFGQLGVPAGTEFARANIDGNAFGYGFNVGARWTPDAAWSVGARYLSRVDVAIDGGDARFRQVSTGLVLPRNNPLGAPGGTTIDQLVAPQFAGTGALTAQSASATIALPDQLSVGVAYTGVANTTLSADVIRFGWQAFETLPLDFANAATPDRELIEDYAASWSVRGGAERRYSNGWIVRGGLSWTQSPAPDATVTPLLPDMDRRNYSVGLGIPLSGLGTRWRLDASYLFVDTDGRRGRVVERMARTETADQLNGGVYTLRAHIASLTLRAAW
ncbi:MAG: outer membrane protein transport protein [Gemmatimonadaceae bacterium]|jgi:long-chain fatty acid transport protein|nr:outer membrane protein transport protein [Gemmatimonadaceae bacterium]